MTLARLAALIVFSTAAQACSLNKASIPTDYILVVDQSGSVSGAERASWTATADSVLKRLTLSDSVLILPVHEHTLDAAPLFHARVPDPGVTLEDIAQGKRRLKEIRETAGRAVHDALGARRPSKGTELLAVVDRVAASMSPLGGRVTRVVLFSDMLNASPALDMERNALSSADMPTLIRTLRRQAGWHNELLAGVKVRCVLNGLDSGRPSAVNDRRVIKAFWEGLFTSVGAELVGFETYAPEKE